MNRDNTPGDGTVPQTPLNLDDVAIVIPALNEEGNLAVLLPLLEAMNVGQIIVCDNGSTDATRAVVEGSGADWIYEPQRGYGAACQAGIAALDDDVSVVAFCDADMSDDLSRLVDLVGPIQRNEYDLVLGARTVELREPGATTFPQRVANVLFPMCVKLGWGHSFKDLGPFRAIGRNPLDRIGMRDRAFGWTIEMQVRAVELGLRILEIPVAYRRRAMGRSKIGGSLTGAARAAYCMIRTCGGLWLTKRRRVGRARP